jgi:hypothetical protein
MKTVPGEPVRKHSTCEFIDGEIRHALDANKLPDACFAGFNLSDSCSAVEGADFERTPRCTSLCSRKMTTNTINGQKLRKLQGSSCATHDQDRLETSEFFLMTSTGLPTNVYGYEFRFRRKDFELDTDIIKCSLKRTACDYSGDFLLGCKATLDETYLAGYHLRVQVRNSERISRLQCSARARTLIPRGP